MGESELKTALQREGEAQVRELWQEAEATVAKRCKEIAAELVHLRAETDRQVQAETAVLSSNLRFKAQARAMECCLRAEAALEERLLHLARQLLPELASAERATLWKTLCEELPMDDWAFLKVHPADLQMAANDFPAAVIESEETLGGGLVATSADGMIRVDNSLCCRMMRAWPDLLPKLMNVLRKQVDKDEVARTDTTC
jgi:vacuolar-type H+-ATPase subunit E/Vma4